jgi:hypothetical protein
MIDMSFIPETLDWCKTHYVPPIRSYITCPKFGESDGMSGECWWCMEMTPYQNEMCRDASWTRNLVRNGKTRDEAAEFIDSFKRKMCE